MVKILVFCGVKTFVLVLYLELPPLANDPQTGYPAKPDAPWTMKVGTIHPRRDSQI